MLLELAILKNFNTGTYKAAVQLAGSLTTYFDDVPVSRAIPTSALVTGNRVILAIPGDNPKDACVIAAWPQGSPGGAEVHGNEFHDPDFASELALSDHASAKQNVHGVGSLYIAKSTVDGLDVAAHKTRHQRSGADELSLDPVQLAEQRSYYHFDGGYADGWTIVGPYSYIAPLDTLVYTNNLVNATAQIYRTNEAYRLQPRENKDIIYKCILVNNSAQEFWLVQTHEGTGFPTQNGDKLGFHVVNDELFAHSASGSAYTEVSMGTFTAWSTHYLKILERGGTTFTFYDNGVYKATITTNLPSTGVPFRLMLAAKTAEAAYKRFYVMTIDIMYGP
jgi:hypothetical protein